MTTVETNTSGGLVPEWTIGDRLRKARTWANNTEACEAAATNQGLNPIRELLADADIAHELEQTGGFTMVVSVPVNDQYYIWITDADLFDGEGAGRALVCLYNVDEDEEIADATVPFADVPMAVRRLWEQAVR